MLYPFTRRGVNSTAALLAALCASVALAQPSTLPTTGPASRPAAMRVALELSPTVRNSEWLRANNMGYMPAMIQLVDQRPERITREPEYNGTPRYGAIRVGNGPKSDTLLVVDAAQEGPERIFIDRNQNNDLTDDGDGAWQEATERDGITSYQSTIIVHASYGTPLEETESGDYGLLIYKRHGDRRLGSAGQGARVGTVELAGKTYPVILVEHNTDGLYILAVRTDRSRRPVDFMIDLDGDGTFRGVSQTIDGREFRQSEKLSLNEPFKIDDGWWIASPSLSGGELLIGAVRTPDAAAAEAQGPTEVRRLLAAGTVAPDFTALLPDGKPIKLSDLRGKTVILDFWATWCGPCKASMPGLEALYAGVKDQNVVVLSVCVWDERDLFDAFVASETGRAYSFTWAFDPAGQDTPKSIAAALYGVSGIPTAYVIDRQGKVVDGLIGSGQEEAMARLLRGQGINVPATQPAPAQ